MAKLRKIWTNLQSSLWFLPVLIVSGTVILAFELIALNDNPLHKDLVERWPRFFATDPEGARAMLSAIASSMITVAGVVFSITIVTLSLASTQYSPRVLRNFMRDKSNQVVLGAFVGVFAYCLVVLRNVTGLETGGKVPSLAVLVGFVLSMTGIGFLIYFIHHIATSIQAAEMVSTIAQETIGTLEKMYPEQQHQNAKLNFPGFDGDSWQPVPSDSTGYVQTLDLEGLYDVACELDQLLRIEHGVGEFVVKGRPIVSIAGSTPPSEVVIRQINRQYAVNSFRTISQDPAFGVRQIVDIALKALSPGINDTGTAITCLDYLSAIFSVASQRQLDAGFLYEQSTLRVLVKRMDFRIFVSDALDQILENAQKNKAVLAHVVSVLGRLFAASCTPSQREVLLEKLEAIAKAASAYPCSSRSRDDLERKIQALREKLLGESSRENVNGHWRAG